MIYKSLKQIGKIITGNTPPTKNKEFYNSPDIPFLKPNNFCRESLNSLGEATFFIAEEARSKARIIPENSVLVTCIGIIGKVGITQFESAFNQQINAIIPEQEICYGRFLAYFLLTKQEYLRNIANAPVVPIINKTQFSNIKIPLPPLATQKKIADILDTADELRKKTKTIIDHYDQLAQSLFLETFGDPVKNPKEWEMKMLGKLQKNKCQNGHYAPKDNYSDQGVKMVHMSDAFYKRVNPKKLKRVILDEKILQKYKLNSTDLLLSRRSLNYEGAAKPCIIPEFAEPIIYESSLIRIRPNTNIINTVFLYYFLDNPRARDKYVFKYVTKSTISGINNKGVNSILIYVPPVSLQNQFEERITLIDRQKELAKKSMEESESLFKTLLQKAFKGEIEVSEAEVVAG